MNNEEREFEVVEPEQVTGEGSNNGVASFFSRNRSAILLAGILSLAALVLIIPSFTRAGNRTLYPILPTMTPLPQLIESNTTELTFAELNSDPAAYRDQRLQVSGVYTPLPAVNCRPQAGVPISWSLVAEGLQLNAVGFESILQLVPPGTELTVVGYWRFYQGPLGCGKAPPVGILWYLEVTQIVQPNPLLSGASSLALTVISGSPLAPLGTIEALTTPTASATPIDTETPIPAVTETLVIISTPGLPQQPTETATFSIPPTVTNTPDPNTTPTIAGTGQPTSTPDPNATPTIPGLATNTPEPGLPTSTSNPNGYPLVTDTPTGGYP